MKILSNFKTFIILLAVGALCLAAVAFMLFTREEVTRAMVEAGDEEIKNVLRVVRLNVENEYKSLEFFRNYSLDSHKSEVKNLVDVAVSTIEFHNGLSKQGVIAESRAKQYALDSVREMRFGENNYFYIYDKNNIAVSHPDPKMQGKNMTDLKDIAGAPILLKMREIVAEKGEGFHTILWSRLGEDEPVRKLLYFKLYPEWNWLVGTGVYIDDIKKDIQKKKAAIMSELENTFANIKVAKTGYFRLFDGEKQDLIRPTQAGMEDADPGRRTKDNLSELIRAAKNPDVPYEYLWDKPDYPGEYRFPAHAFANHIEPFNWYIAGAAYKDEMEQPACNILKRQAAFLAIFVLVCILIVYRLVGRATRPLLTLERYAEKLQENDFSMPREETETLLSITFPSEIGGLAKTIYGMERKLEDYLKKLEETATARERIESELRIARDIQMSMLPCDFKEYASCKSADLFAALFPARDVGGDLYDYFLVDEDHLCLVVGDVSDKGVPAALFMARSMAALRIAATGNLPPDAVLAGVNETLERGNKMCMFLTLFLGILDLKTGTLVFSNAGHVPPYILPAGGGDCRELELPKGTPLGLPLKAEYATREVTLNPGDGLFIFTDGITEAMNDRDEFFTEERLEKVLNAVGSLGAEEIVAKVLEETASFSRPAPQADDIAALAVRFIGS